MSEIKNCKLPASFRDPSGNVFSHNGKIFRQVNNSYREHYDQAVRTGLFVALINDKLLISHQEVDVEPLERAFSYRVLEPEPLPFVSYPYEWCFGQLKDAALLTLQIQIRALEKGLTLKDASAYNIQFINSRPIFIDTLSFEKYREGEPWAAYRQFCEHFLAPLTLMSYRDVRLAQLQTTFIDGIPLDLTSNCLPFASRFRFGIVSHIHLHASAQRKYAGTSLTRKQHLSLFAHRALIDNLKSTVEKLTWTPSDTPWGNYYTDTNYSVSAFDAKKKIVREFVNTVSPKTVWDLGANTGEFSKIAAENGARTIAFDLDYGAVEKSYQECKRTSTLNILPLHLDLSCPSPAVGWNNKERLSLIERGPADLTLALAIIHHLAISGNSPFENIAELLSQLSSHSIIEFVPKSDSQVQRLLSTRTDIFPDYTEEQFCRSFEKYFLIENVQTIPDSKRTLYLMKKRYC